MRQRHASTDLAPSRYGACGLEELGKTIDCNRSKGWRGGSQCVFKPACNYLPRIYGSLPRLNRHCGPRRNGRQTQLLSLVLAARFRKPWPIVLGIFVATMINHGLAGAVGAWINAWVGPDAMRWILGVSFIAMAIWMLIPDKLDDEGVDNHSRWGVFGTTVVAFFLAEMGDKTQIATVMLAAQYNAYLWVVLGTTLGMMLANAPVVWLGDKLVKKVPIRMVHIVSAGIFLVLGVLALLSKDVPALA